ncbi:hypothetical protein ASG89_11435 [Paenibacillus sp. Soil766]|uniref:Wadjet anti-phage system protein JetD domain-containing protein n=1 Tax=Paenibacillus sp. Soil766 TaxID=1736404 RepID=UPI00070B8110|nr:Wadjet anti-phage system protein JetD domain-containing protein [Paenibacillus sp. Soil766]KRE83731.1 hypothetical protein ASG89_11435 [Paenibacillus sp. Soil766]
MNFNSRIRTHLLSLKKVKVSIDELYALFDGQPCTYEQFAQSVLELEAEKIIQMVQSKGRTGKRPSLAYQYSVQKNRLKVDTHKDIHQARMLLHPDIQLDAYYSLGAEIWEQDKLYIAMIDTYLKEYMLPTTPVPAPERSFELVADEKWITEKRGGELLTRIGLWDKFLILLVDDPLMFAVNPYGLTNEVHRHLIVENKTTYQALLQALPDVPFATLIFGGGYRITKSIELLSMQLPLKDPVHEFYYFGDIDKKGIHIWHLLNEQVIKLFGRPAKLAFPFYRACLSRKFAKGKEYQRSHEQALQTFTSHFTEEERKIINQCLASGGYFPQEILPSHELCRIWRHTAWTT